MKTFFRKLSFSDVPQINEISKEIWEGEDYVPSVIENWLKQENCLNYGVFEDREKIFLLGFGRVKYYSNGIAWFEGGRVRPSFQRRGIGRSIIQYAVTEAKKAGARVAQYDTSSKNQGSLALAREFGFKEKKQMQLLFLEPSDFMSDLKSFTEIEKIDATRAKLLYNDLEIGSGSEICIGWSYIPIDLLTDTEFTWFKLEKSVLHAPNLIEETVYEKPNEEELWMITYGDPIHNKVLIEYLLSRNIHKYHYKTIIAFCQPETAKIIHQLGFRYENDEPSSVILFEKSLI